MNNEIMLNENKSISKMLLNLAKSTSLPGTSGQSVSLLMMAGQLYSSHMV